MANWNIQDGSKYFILVIVLHACAVWAQGGTVDNCWFEAPELPDTSVVADIIPTNRTEADGSTSWNLQARVTWQRPTGMQADDMYTIKLKNVDGMVEGESVVVDPCLVYNDEIMLDTEEYVFQNLSFGQLYELEIHLYRPVRQQKSMMGAMIAFETPDCFQVTGDWEFCHNIVDVQHSGAPVEPQVNNLCRNSSTALLRVTLSWLPPYRVNGQVFLYSIDYGVVVTPPPAGSLLEAPSVTLDTVNIAPPPPPAMGALSNGTNQTDTRIKAELQGLEEGKLYYVRITPIVNSPSDGGMYPGNDVELTLVTANWTDPSGQTTEINIATPHCDVFDNPSLVPTSGGAEVESSSPGDSMTTQTTSPPWSSMTMVTTLFNATTPARVPPTSMDPTHIALIVIFTLLIVSVIGVFIFITIRMAITGKGTKLPQLSKLPAMCRRDNVKADEKKTKNLNMAEKGVVNKSNSTSPSKAKEVTKANK